MARPAKPTQLKVLHGDRKDRVNVQEPVPAEQPIVPPVRLSKAAQEVWDRQAPDRIAKGCLTPWDVDAFALFCELVALSRKGLREAKRKSEVGGPAPTRMLKDTVGMLTALGGRFGWTPSDRARLTMAEAPRDKVERLLS